MVATSRYISTLRGIPQTGLALMGFSRYCPSSLDLTNFVVQERRGVAAENALAISGSRWLLRPVGHETCQLTALNLEIQESGNPGIWKSENLEVWNPKRSKK